MVFSPLLTPRKMILELLMGRGAASPHLKPLCALANLLAHVLPRALPPQRHDPVGKMTNICGRQGRKGPARWS